MLCCTSSLLALSGRGKVLYSARLLGVKNRGLEEIGL